MGNLKYFSLLIAAGMFAACSDNLENAGNVNEGPKTGEGYVKVAINLPSVSSSRATDGSTDLNDGDAKEYAVKNGIIAFFEQAKTSATDPDDEKDAKFVKAYYMSLTFNEEEPDDDHVTSTTDTEVIQTLNAPVLSGENNQMYALVILNNGLNNSIVSVENDGKRLSFKSGDAPIILEPGSSIDGLYKSWLLNAGNITSDENGFLMLNSPLSNSYGTQVQTLVPVTVSSDPDEAETANIYVERVVAKVDVSINTTSADYFTETSGDPSSTKRGLNVKKDGSIYTGDKVVFIDSNTGAEPLGWTLNVTNKNTKPLRDVSDVDTWKGYNITNAGFIGTSAVYESWFRIYWAKDNNYDATATDFNVYNTKENKLPATWGAYSTSTSAGIVPQYCLENTAPAASVKDNNTTAVLIKATYWVDEIADEEDKSFFMIGDDAATVTKADFLKRIEEKLSVASGTLSINADADGGYYTGATELKTLITGFSGDTYDTALEELGTIRYYKDGGCYYYAVPIKHFTITKPAAGTDINDSNYLGAYGVVRNNWYQITINSVSGPGAPEITNPGDEGVEDEESYIKCSINVLSWAKRTQDVDL